VLNLLFLLILTIVVLALVRSGPQPLAEKTALVLALDGSIAEQRAGNLRSTALDQLRGETTPQKMQLRDILAVIDTAAKDDKITSAVLILDELDATGLATLREIGAAVDRFRARGKKVVAWGSSFDQRQYYIAAHADEIYLHPLGAVNVTGFGGVQNYYKEALDKLGVERARAARRRLQELRRAVDRQRALARGARGRRRAARLALEDLHRRDREAEEARAGSVMKSIDEAPARLAAVGGDRAKLALADKAVDGLKTRDELRALMISRGVEDVEHKTFRQTSFDEYLARLRPRLTGEAVGVVVAEGEIVDGTAPIGTIGGLSTANLIRKARDDKDVKAVVLRVNSPGGSVFGSELVRRELELTRAAGKPVVVSMGDLAASGGYWISTASDEIIADPSTVTGSIGVIALLPNFAGTLDKLGVHSSTLATTWLRSAFDPRVPLDPRLADMIQRSVDHDTSRSSPASRRRARPRRTRSTRSRRAASGRARRRSSAA
jgi:protease-4